MKQPVRSLMKLQDSWVSYRSADIINAPLFLLFKLVTCEWDQRGGTGSDMVAACFVPAADLHFRSFLCRVICGLRLLRRSVSPHRSPSEETTGYQGICTGCLCGLLRLQQSLGTGDPDRQGRPPQATLALAGMSRTGLIPGLLRSSLLLPETLSLDPRLCLYAGPGGKRLESQPHR